MTSGTSEQVEQLEFKAPFDPTKASSEDDPSPTSVAEIDFVDPFQIEFEENDCDLKPLVKSGSTKTSLHSQTYEAPQIESRHSAGGQSIEPALAYWSSLSLEDTAGQEDQQVRAEASTSIHEATVGLDVEAGESGASDLYLACLAKKGGGETETGIAGIAFERADVLPRAAMVTGRHSIGEYDHFQTDEDQRLYVKTVATGSVAEAVGVTIGSTLISINGQPVEGRTCSECVAMVMEAWGRVMSRPAGPSISLQLQRGQHQALHGLQGQIFARVSTGAFSVGGIRGGKMQYKPKYYAVGGCNMNYLQLFDNEEHYQKTHSSTACHILASKLPALHLTKYHRCSPIKHKLYKGHGGLYYFKLEIPSMKFTAAKFGAIWSEDADAMRNALLQAIEADERRAVRCVIDAIGGPQSRTEGRRNSV
jgi:hypothetical protein